MVCIVFIISFIGCIVFSYLGAKSALNKNIELFAQCGIGFFMLTSFISVFTILSGMHIYNDFSISIMSMVISLGMLFTSGYIAKFILLIENKF